MPRPALAATAGLALLLGPAALAVPTGATVALAPHGDAIDGTSGQPVALSPTSFLVAAEGADGLPGTGDDVTLLVKGVGGTPSIRSLATGNGATDAARIERLSASRAALVSSGDDALFGTADDALLILDRLGSTDAVVPVVLGGLGDNQQFTPERLTSNQVAIPSFGADLLPDTADDEVVVVTISPAPATAERLAAPYQRAGGRTRLVALSPDAFLVASDGPDRKSSGADDLVYAFVRTDGTWNRTDLAAPGLNRRSAGRSVRLSPRYGLVVSAGADFTDSTADDEVLLLDVQGAVTPLAVHYARNGSGGQPTVLAPDLAVVGTRGADGVDGTADDAVAVLSGLGSTNTVRSLVIGPSGDNNECRPVRLRNDSFALATFGADRVVGTPDDSITIVTGIGGTPLVQTVQVGSLANGSSSTLVPLSPRSLLVSGGGPDGAVNTSDDAVVVLSGIGGSLAVHSVPLRGALDAPDAFRYVPVVLGDRRAALLTSGADGDLGEGGDDGVLVLDGLDFARALRVNRMKARFAGAGKSTGRPSRLEVRGAIALEEPESLLEEDVTVSVGNAAQTLAAGSLLPEGGGRFLRYRDPAGVEGIVRDLRIDTLLGTVRIDVRGADDDVASTDPDYVPVGLDVGGTLVPDLVTARSSSRGFGYRRPRGAE